MAKRRRRGGGQRKERAAAEASARAREPVSAAVTIPRWLPAATFVGLTVVLFRDFIFSDLMLLGGDTMALGYVARAWYADALATLGRIPGWAPGYLGGTPFLEALAGGDSLYPPSLLLLLLLEPHRALGWKLVLHYVAAGLFMFGWLRALGRSRAAALVGGTAYLLAPYFVSLVRPGHDGKIFVTALAPLLFWAVERHFGKPGLRTVCGIALVVGVILLTTHFQMAYFLFGAVGLYAIFRTIEMGRAGAEAEEPSDDGQAVPPPPSPWRPAGSRFALFLGASVLGAGVASVQLLPAFDYVNEHSRRIATTRASAGETGAAWSSSWSLHPEEALSMVIPEFAGNNGGGAEWAEGTYWGRNGHKDNHEGTGIVIVLLAAVAFTGAATSALRFFFLGLATLAFMFALGAHTPIWGVFYSFVYGINQFRAPSQAMFLFAFSAATLGALGLDRILGARREHVGLMDELRCRRARLDDARPPNDERYAVSAFPDV